MTLRAAATVGVRREVVFAFLADLRNHWRLAARWVELESLSGPSESPTGGTVAIRAPLGLRRAARTRVLALDPPHGMRGSATIGSRTEARVRWTLDEAGRDRTRVVLEIEIVRAGVLDRVLLAIGGRTWVRRRVADTLARLEQLEDLGEKEPAHPELARAA